MNKSLQAVLWDLDGTLVDTEPVWMAAETELAQRFGRAWSHADGLQLVGLALLDSAAIFQAQTGVPLSTTEIVDELVAGVRRELEQHIQWRPGVLALLAEIAASPLQQGLVTMSYDLMAGVIVSQLPTGTFDVIVTGDQVAQGKPHPEPYLTAAHALGVRAAECLALEDSPTGLASASAAGCVTIGVPCHLRLPDHPAYTVKQTLADQALSDLQAWHAEAIAVRY